MKEIKQKNVKVGRGTYYTNNIDIIPSKDGVEFGQFCSIGPNLNIIGYNHDYNFPTISNPLYLKWLNCKPPIDKQSSVYSKGKIIIGNDVWFGNDVVILSGVSIGDGCCIGARSIVTKSLPPYTICAGSPCKIIKNRYDKKTIDFLLQLQWWNWSDDKIKKNKTFFTTNINNISCDQIKSLIVD